MTKLLLKTVIRERDNAQKHRDLYQLKVVEAMTALTNIRRASTIEEAHEFAAGAERKIIAMSR